MLNSTKNKFNSFLFLSVQAPLPGLWLLKGASLSGSESNLGDKESFLSNNQFNRLWRVIKMCRQHDHGTYMPPGPTSSVIRACTGEARVTGPLPVWVMALGSVLQSSQDTGETERENGDRPREEGIAQTQTLPICPLLRQPEGIEKEAGNEACLLLLTKLEMCPVLQTRVWHSQGAPGKELCASEEVGAPLRAASGWAQL